MVKEEDEYAIEDLYATMWRGVPQRLDPETQSYDIYTRDLEQDQILVEAVKVIEADPAAMERLALLDYQQTDANGEPMVDADGEPVMVEMTPQRYITGRGVGTYVGSRWENPEIMRAVTEYQATTNGMAENNWYGYTRDDVWDDMVARDDELRALMEDYGKRWTEERKDQEDPVPWRSTYRNWFEASVEDEVDAIVKQRGGEESVTRDERDLIRKEAEGIVGGFGTATDYSDERNIAERQWMTIYPELALRAFAYGLIYISPSEKDMLDNLPVGTE